MKINGWKCSSCGSDEIFVNENHAYYQCNGCERAIDLSEYFTEEATAQNKINYDVYINDGSNYVSWDIGDDKICIDGNFTIEGLGNIISRVLVMKHIGSNL